MLKKIHCKDCNNLECFIKKGCDGSWLEIINEHKITSNYGKDQYVFYEGSSVLGLYFIMHGSFKVVSTGINDKAQIVRFAKKSGVLGHRGLGGEKYPIGAIALEDSVICFLDNNLIYDVIIGNPKLSFNLMMYYSEELRKSELRIKDLSQMNVREKVADGLSKLIELFGMESKDGIAIQLELSRQDFADFIGINTEQLSRMLSEFKKDNIISIVDKNIVVIQPNELYKMLKPFTLN